MQINMTPDFRCRDPKLWINMQIKKLNEGLGFCGCTVQERRTAKIKVLNYYLRVIRIKEMKLRLEKERKERKAEFFSKI